MTPKNIPQKDKLRYATALNIEHKSQEQIEVHIYTMIASKNMLYYGGYIPQEEADKIQSEINAAARKYDIQINDEELNKIRIIFLPFE